MLRIHPTDYHIKEAILEEFKWLEFILKTTELSVPKALYSCEGKYIVEGNHAKISGRRCCDMFEWIEGRTLWKNIDRNYAYNLGSLMGRLQKNGKGVKINHRYYWNTEGLVGTKKARFCNVEHLTDITIKQQEIITYARRCAYNKLQHYENTHPEKLGCSMPISIRIM